MSVTVASRPHSPSRSQPCARPVTLAAPFFSRLTAALDSITVTGDIEDYPPREPCTCHTCPFHPDYRAAQEAKESDTDSESEDKAEITGFCQAGLPQCPYRTPTAEPTQSQTESHPRTSQSAADAKFHPIFSSSDLIFHSTLFLTPRELCVLTSVTQLVHRVSDSDRCWRPRLLAGFAIADPSRKTDSVPHHDCKHFFLREFTCVHSQRNGCRQLLAPAPPLPLPAANALHAHALILRYPPPPCPCNPAAVIRSRPQCQSCIDSLALTIKRYYDDYSEWSGQFTMTPLAIIVVTDRFIDVRYWHVGGYEGIDSRRFVLSYDTVNGEWKIEAMLGYRSGCYAMNATDNVTQTQQLQYSKLMKRIRYR